jgi:UDP-glucose 4-epimerase
MPINTPRVAVVGARGFIGSSLVKYLQNADIEVAEFNSNQSLTINENLNPQMQGVSSVIWCASRVNPTSAASRPDLCDTEMAEWISFLETWSKKSTPSQRIVFLSSGGCTYSTNELPFREDSEAAGINEYGKLKVAMEKELLLSNIPHLILRVANVYGPGQQSGRGQGVIAEWKHSIANNQDIKVYGSLESFRDYIYIDDLCEGIFQSLGISQSNHILNLGSGVATNLKNILEIVRLLDSDHIKIDLAEKRQTDRTGYFLDITKIKNLTKWAPKYSIEEGLRHTIGTIDE